LDFLQHSISIRKSFYKQFQEFLKDGCTELREDFGHCRLPEGMNRHCHRKDIGIFRNAYEYLTEPWDDTWLGYFSGTNNNCDTFRARLYDFTYGYCVRYIAKGRQNFQESSVDIKTAYRAQTKIRLCNA
jgi:hypothetical protein